MSEEIKNKEAVHPMQIVMNNVRALAAMDREKCKETLLQQLDVLRANFTDVEKNDKGEEVHFDQNPARIMQAVIGILSMQLYCEHLLKLHHLGKPDIKIVSPDQMPKA